MTNIPTHALTPILPLLYVAWVDAVLSPSEIRLIRQQGLQYALSEEDRGFMLKFTDAMQPPSENQLSALLDLIRDRAAGLPETELENLAELGYRLAEQGHTRDTFEKNTYKGLTALCEALALDRPDTATKLLAKLGWKEPKDLKDQAHFDAPLWSKILDYRQYEIKQKVRTLLNDPLFTRPEGKDKSIQRQHTLEGIKMLAGQGFGSMAYGKDYGGKEDMEAYMAVFETLCFYDLNYAVKFGVQFGLFGGTVWKLGTDLHHMRYLRDIGTGHLLGCFAMTETGHGSNVKDIETTAVYQETEKTLIIHSPTFTAGKEYIGNALHATMAVVFAQLMVKNINHGVHAILVPLRDEYGNTLPGITIKDCGYKMGLNGIDNGRIWFNNVSVPKENLLNRFGDITETGEYKSPIAQDNKRFFTMLGSLVGGRICVGLGALNASIASLALAVNYAHERRQFRPDEDTIETLLIDYPSHQHRLMPLLVKSLVFHNALSSLASQFVNGPESDIRKIETKAAGLKALASWHCTRTIQECREACGGKGYLSENRFGDLKADSDIFTTFEGDNTVLLQLVAKGLLTEFNQSFNDDGFRGMLRYLGNKIGFTLSEINVYQSRKTRENHLLDDDFLSDALRYREKKQRITLAERMRKYIREKVSPHEAFLKCQVHMGEAARSYIERLAYRDMIKRIDQLNASPEKELLIKLTRFYALTIIMENRYWFLENDYMDGTKTKAIRRLYSRFMEEIKGVSKDILSAFNLPGHLTSIKP
ncbi:MAG: acyl-CoA dehydrogenase family protein [Saprospiraceae bacterium]|nr:acyl-CoA dehydrogenase family protein [Saprospiraceae bacterium]